MKRKYQKPTFICLCMVTDEPMLVDVSSTQGGLSDGTHIGDGGDEDGDVVAYTRQNSGLWE